MIECIPKLPDLQIATIAKFSPIEYSLELNVLEHISVEDEEAHENEPCGLPDVDEDLLHLTADYWHLSMVPANRWNPTILTAPVT